MSISTTQITTLRTITFIFRNFWLPIKDISQIWNKKILSLIVTRNSRDWEEYKNTAWLFCETFLLLLILMPIVYILFNQIDFISFLFFFWSLWCFYSDSDFLVSLVIKSPSIYIRLLLLLVITSRALRLSKMGPRVDVLNQISW